MISLYRRLKDRLRRLNDRLDERLPTVCCSPNNPKGTAAVAITALPPLRLLFRRFRPRPPPVVGVVTVVDEGFNPICFFKVSKNILYNMKR